MYQTIEELLGVAPPSVLNVEPGKTVRITATVSYQGPALDDVFRGVIGSRHPVTGFAEWWVGRTSIHFNASTGWVAYTLTADIAIPANQSPTLADIYCKIEGHLEAGLPEYDGVINIISVAPQFQDFKITDYSKL